MRLRYAILLTFVFLALLLLSDQIKSPVLIERDISLHVESIKRGDSVFNVLYNGRKVMFWQEKLKLYKVCIGDSSPKVVNTDCSILDSTISVIHEIDPLVDKKVFPVCFYTDQSLNKCFVGDNNGPFVIKSDK